MSDLVLGRLVVVVLGAVLLAGVVSLAMAAKNYPPRGLRRATFAAMSFAFAVVVAIAQILLYRDISHVRVPPDEPFFLGILIGETVLFVAALVWAAALDPYARTKPN